MCYFFKLSIKKPKVSPTSYIEILVVLSFNTFHYHLGQWFCMKNKVCEAFIRAGYEKAALGFTF